ncbi:MAG: hypothetical protein ABUK01_01095 [Leptospirales bacterium]
MSRYFRKFFPNVIIAVIFSFLCFDTLAAVAGRGGSYNSGSGSSGSSGSSSSGSSSSGSSGWSTYDDDDEEVYSGPYYSDDFNYTEYNTWLTIQKNGQVKVREELHIENPDSSYVSRPFYKQYKNIKVVPGSLKVSGDVSSFNENFQIELSPEEASVKLVILEYTIENPFYRYQNELRLVWHSYPYGPVAEGYFQIELPSGVKFKSLSAKGGSIGSLWGYAVSEFNFSPLKGLNGKYFYYRDKTRAHAYDIDIRLNKNSISSPKNDSSEAAFYTRNADYNIIILEDEQIVFRNSYDVKRLKEEKTPVLHLAEFFLIKDFEDGAYPEEAMSSPVLFTPVSKNLNYSEGFEIETSVSKEKFTTVEVEYKGYGFTEEYEQKKYITLVLPTLGSNERFYGKEAYTERSSATIQLPDGADMKTVKWKTWYGQMLYNGHFAYWEELKPTVQTKDGKLHFKFNEPVLNSGRILIELEVPPELTSPTFGKRIAYNFDFSSSATRGWLSWIIGIVSFIIFVVLLMFFIMREPKTRPTNNWKMPLEAAQALAKSRGGRDKQIQSFLQETDPDFNMERFIATAKNSALLLQKGWSENKMLDVRNHISQGLLNRFRLQLKMMLEIEKLRNVTVKYSVSKAVPVKLESTGRYDTIHLLLFEKARDLTIETKFSLKEALAKARKTSYIKFAQVYSFTRKRGAKTSTKNMDADSCPACGGKVEQVGQSNICPYCSARFNSGEYDWVLNEITQATEWKEPVSGKTGLTETLQKYGADQVLEDRASYLFWEWLYAQSLGKKGLLDRHATANFIKAFSDKKIQYYEPAIGSVEVKSRKDIDARFVSSTFLFKWSAAQSKTTSSQNRTTMMKLILDKTTFPDSGFADEGCPNCGAPVWEESIKVCRFCLTKLPPISYDWLLHKIQ